MASAPPATRRRSAELMRRECCNLLNEIDRLDKSGKIVDEQLQNVMNLVCASLVIQVDDLTVPYDSCSAVLKLR